MYQLTFWAVAVVCGCMHAELALLPSIGTCMLSFFCCCDRCHLLAMGICAVCVS